VSVFPRGGQGVANLMSLVVGVFGGANCSPLAPLMIAAGVAVHLSSSSGRHWTKRRAKALPAWSVSTTAASSGVVVLLGGVVGMLPAWSLSSR
jgi:hypothetical protein